MKRLLLLVALISTACAVSPPPVTAPNPAPAPTSLRFAVTATTSDRQAVPGLQCDLVPDGQTALSCAYNGVQLAAQGSPASVDTGGDLTVWADGYTRISTRVIFKADGSLHDTNDQPFELHLEIDAPPLPRLVPVGQYFKLEGGAPTVIIGASEFNLLNRFRNGEDIEPVLSQLESYGFNQIRVFTVYDICATGVGDDGRPCQSIGRSAPTPDLYAAIPGFSKALARHHLYAELVAFTGPYVFFQNDDAKVAHWEAFIAATSGLTNITREMVNEFDHPANDDIPIARLRRPSDGVLTSHGSATQDVMPLQPFWDYVTYHPGGGPEWMRKVGHNAWEDAASWSNVVTVSNETTRAPDSDGNAAHFYDAAAGASLFNGGADFHSIAGKAGVPFSAAEQPLAQAWVAGAKSVPLACQGQPYRNLNVSENDPTYWRAYQRGNDPACIVHIRK